MKAFLAIRHAAIIGYYYIHALHQFQISLSAVQPRETDSSEKSALRQTWREIWVLSPPSPFGISPLVAKTRHCLIFGVVEDELLLSRPWMFRVVCKFPLKCTYVEH